MGITLLLELETFSAIKFDLMKISFLGPANQLFVVDVILFPT